MVKFILEELMNCPYCNYNRIYHLNTGQGKCSKCLKKFSLKKIQRDNDLVKAFCDNKSANESSKEIGLNYLSVKKRYDLFRVLIANYLEEQYNQYPVKEYDEYIYLPKSKKKIPKNIFDSHNFLTFNYNNTQVYNLLMPNLNSYKEQFLDDGLDETYFKEFSKFMMYNKIAKTTKRENTITRFWNFFESSIVKYKGINSENFIYYLKEYEFKFNYSKEKARELLTVILKKHLYT